MSRIGRYPINIPDGTTVTINGTKVLVKGAKGELEVIIPAEFEIEQSDTELKLTQKIVNRQTNSLYGLLRTLLANAVIGTSTGFSKQLELNGVGFRVEKKGQGLQFSLGFSHKIDFSAPEGVDLSVEGNVITVTGINKQVVGQIAAQIRELKKPEPYKGKGLKYIDEHVRRKAGKAAVKGA